MPTRSSNNPEVDEETPLLVNTKKPSTPLEWSQIVIVLLVLLCEPLTSQSIFPYINKLVGGLDITGGDERKVGYYAGLIESLFFATQALTVFQWSRYSDLHGRKPILLIGLIGLSISITCFGLSRTLWALIVSRCLNGVLNGNIGIMKSVLGELTDSTNRAEVFSFMPVVWSGGSTLGPLIGGSLANPHDRFPNVFRGTFWKKFPYFLPSGVVASFVILLAIVVFVFFKETLQINKAPQSPTRRDMECSDAEATPSGHLQPTIEGPVPLRELFVFRVLITISNFLVLGFLDMGILSLHPLFMAMPINIGGLGLSPPTIGYILGSYGAVNGIFQAVFLGKRIKYYGLKSVFCAGMFSFIPMFCLFPIINIVARWEMLPLVWMLLAFQFVLKTVSSSTYTCISIYITSAAPNKRSLGSTNGLAQTSVSIARALGPAISTSLFSFSVEHNIIGGYGVYVIFALLSALALVLAVQLPKGEWKQDTDEARAQ